MTPRDFCLWVRGFMDAVDGQPNRQVWDQLEDQLGQVDMAPGREPRHATAPSGSGIGALRWPSTVTVSTTPSVETGTPTQSGAMWITGEKSYPEAEGNA